MGRVGKTVQDRQILKHRCLFWLACLVAGKRTPLFFQL